MRAAVPRGGGAGPQSAALPSPSPGAGGGRAPRGGGGSEPSGDGARGSDDGVAGPGYLAGDEVLADGESHLNGVGFVRDRGGVELQLPGAVPLVGLVHRLAEDLLVLLGAQHRADIDDLGVTAGAGERGGEEQGEQQQPHGAHPRAARSPPGPRPPPAARRSARPHAARRGAGSSPWC